MKAGKAIAWLFISALGIAGIYVGIGVKQLMSFCYNIVKYEVKIDFDYIYLNLTLNFKNPSYLKIDIVGYDLDVYINNGYIGKTTSKKYVPLKTGAFSSIVIPAKIPYLKMKINGKEILNAFTEKRFADIFISLKGKFDGTVLGVAAHVPVDYKITLQEIIKIMDAPASAPCT